MGTLPQTGALFLDKLAQERGPHALGQAGFRPFTGGPWPVSAHRAHSQAVRIDRARAARKRERDVRLHLTSASTVEHAEHEDPR